MLRLIGLKEVAGRTAKTIEIAILNFATSITSMKFLNASIRCMRLSRILRI